MNTTEKETYPLDDATIGSVAEWTKQRDIAQACINAVLMNFARQHQLGGNLQLAQNQRELLIEKVQQQQQEETLNRAA